MVEVFLLFIWDDWDKLIHGGTEVAHVYVAR